MARRKDIETTARVKRTKCFRCDRNATWPYGNAVFCSQRCAALEALERSIGYEYCDNHREWRPAGEECFGCWEDSRKAEAGAAQ